MIAVGIPSGYAQKDSKSGVRPQVISLPGGPGSIEGLGESFEPQLNSGSARYSVPLDVSPGRAGFQPVVTLIYDSGIGNGVLGVGWQMSGMYVQRQTDKGLPQYGSGPIARADTFINESGEELVRVEGDDSSALQVFRCKNERSFAKYEYIPGENRWVCTDALGRRYFLGARADQTGVSARVSRGAGAMNTFSWHIAEARDTNGNGIFYNYMTDGRQVYCSAITYGNVDNGAPLSQQHTINFEYDGNRPDPYSDYRSTFRVQTNMRLKRVVMRTAGQLVRSYRIAYETGVPISRIASITEVGSDDVSTLPPAEYSYTTPVPRSFAALNAIGGLSLATMLPKGANPDAFLGASEVLDFNGDGLPDLYQSANPSSPPGEYDVLYENRGNAEFQRIALSMAESAGLKIQSSNSFVQDMNGDGLPDLIAQEGSNPSDFAFRLNEGGEWAASTTPLNFGSGQTIDTTFRSPDARQADLDSDKQIDLIRTYTSVGPSGTGVFLEAFLSNGNGGFTTIASTMGADRLAGLPVTFADAQGLLLLADMNGDRLQDLVLLADATNGGPAIWPGMGYGRFDDALSGYPILLTDGPDFQGDPSQLADFQLQDLNGDGLADLFRIIGNEVQFWPNEGGVQFGSRSTIILGASYDAQDATYRIMDVDGDGLSEIVFYAFGQTVGTIPTGFHYVELFADSADPNGPTPAPKPNLVRTITNGIGLTTTISYRSSVEDMIRDRDASRPWAMSIPFPVNVIVRRDVHDGLQTYTTQYQYHDGYYDGAEKEFRGFGGAEQADIGDGFQPTLVTVSTFDVGEPIEARKGRVLTTEARESTDDGPIYFRDEYAYTPVVLRSGSGSDPRTVTYVYRSDHLRRVVEKGSGPEVGLHTTWQQEFDSGLAHGVVERVIQTEFGRTDGAWDDERKTVTTFSAAHQSGIDNWILRREVEQLTTDENDVFVARRQTYHDGFAVIGQVAKGNPTRVSSFTDATHAVNAVRNVYDEYGNITEIHDALSDFSSTHFRRIEYDNTFNTYPVKETIYTGGAILEATATYDPGFGVIATSTDFNGFTTTYGYDTFGRLTSTIKPPDSSPTVVYDYQLAQPISGGRVINWVETRQNDGTPTLDSRTFYDGLGRVVMTRAEGEEAGQIVVSNTVQFNSRRNAAAKFLPYFDTGSLDYKDPDFGASAHTTHHFDAVGREVQMTQPDGTFAQTTYTPLMRLTRDEEQTRSDSPYEDCGMRYVHDGLLGDDGVGRLREVYEIVKLQDNGEPGPLTEWKTTYTYDLNNNFTGYTDSQGNVKTVIYDGLSRMVQMNDPDRGVMTYEYDDANNLVRTVDAKNQTIRYKYDGANRLLREFYSASGNTPDVAYHYDVPFGPVPSRDYPELTLTQRVAEAVLEDASPSMDLDLNTDNRVDAADVVTAERQPVKKNDNPPMATAQNTRGYLAWVQDQSGEEHNSYDSRGRLAWTVKRIHGTEPNELYSFQTEYSYDSLDRYARVTYPDGDYVDYQYNPRGLIEAIPNVFDRCDYIATEQNARLEFACGVVTTWQFDIRQRLTRIQSLRESDGASLQDLNFLFDAASNITSITDLRSEAELDAIGSELGIDSATSRLFSLSQTFAYDSLYRLTSATNPGVYGAIDCRYDKIGNMIRQDASLSDPKPHLDQGEMSYGQSAGPHALTQTKNGNNTYDSNGNLLSEGGLTLEWDSKDRVMRSKRSTATTEYLYDYNNARKKKSTDETATWYIDRHSELRDGRLVKYVYVGIARIAMSGAQSMSGPLIPEALVLNDNLSSAIVQVDDSGTVIAQTAYFPYGEPRLQSRINSGATSRYGFINKERDVESGLHYFGARFLQAASGRFVSVDPLMEGLSADWLVNPQRLNPYAYGLASPTRYVDTDGFMARSRNESSMSEEERQYREEGYTENERRTQAIEAKRQRIEHLRQVQSGKGQSERRALERRSDAALEKMKETAERELEKEVSSHTNVPKNPRTYPTKRIRELVTRGAKMGKAVKDAADARNKMLDNHYDQLESIGRHRRELERMEDDLKKFQKNYRSGLQRFVNEREGTTTTVPPEQQDVMGTQEQIVP